MDIHRQKVDQTTLNEENDKTTFRKPRISKQDRQQDRPPENEPYVYKWIKYIVYFWIVRLAFQNLILLYPISWNIWHLFTVLEHSSSKYRMEDIQVKSWNENLIRLSKSKHTFPTKPYVIKNIPLHDPAAIEEMVWMTIKRFTKTAKTSNSSKFTYFSSHQPWSRLFNNSDSHSNSHLGYHLTPLEYIPRFHRSIKDDNEDHNTVIDSQLNGLENKPSFSHWYISQPLPSFIKSAWLHSISTEFQRFVLTQESKYKSTVEANILLWMASTNITVRYHYDMDLNYFLQLSGSKTFELAMPSTYELLKPYSYLHPFWRQAQEEGDILTHTNTDTYRRITLEAGDILVIPPFCFHKVISGENSISVNAWLPSPVSILQEKMSKSIPLPYKQHDKEEIKLTALGLFTRLVMESLGNRTEFINHMITRYPSIGTSTITITDDDGSCEIKETCSSDHNNALTHNINHNDNKLNSTEIIDGRCLDSLLKGSHHFDFVLISLKYTTDLFEEMTGTIESSILIILFMDFIEENLDMILRDRLTPTTARIFVQTCIDSNDTSMHHQQLKSVETRSITTIK